MTTPLSILDDMIEAVGEDIFDVPSVMTYPATEAERDRNKARILRRYTLNLTHEILEAAAVRMPPMYDPDRKMWHWYEIGNGLVHASTPASGLLIVPSISPDLSDMPALRAALAPVEVTDEARARMWDRIRDRIEGDAHQTDGLSE